RKRPAGDRISGAAGERAQVPGECLFSSGCQRGQLSAARFQAPDGLFRMHRRPASFGLHGGAAGPASEKQGRRGSSGRTSGTGAADQMKAMVLAAGLGTRLLPLTNDRPKALVEINGRTLLEITLSRLKSFGIREVIVNAHHFARMVIEYLRANQ